MDLTNKISEYIGKNTSIVCNAQNHSSYIALDKMQWVYTSNLGLHLFDEQNGEDGNGFVLELSNVHRIHSVENGEFGETVEIDFEDGTEIILSLYKEQ